MLELTDPAGPAVSIFPQGMGTGWPFSYQWGVARLSPGLKERMLVLLEFMPSGAKILSLRLSSQLWPVTLAIIWPAAMNMILQ